ncbi:MAG: ATP synthase F1 subunit epsilon [Rhodospirillaceae bacterium]|nr:ATP synthase F1 subunit epsilon [Rhodospirillaceae bacterium]MDG1887564.1 ATP synthase F1 subunit epsilon [Alphaproteobacteria bacterium]|tara:strand:+ start:530 stop:940 length:411 start_codon:yes stop_codon:yes gene_type:complete
MAETTLFELVSPERLIISKDVSMVVVPGTEGLFGVLPRHTSMLSALAPGVIDIYEEDVITERVFVINGFAEVTGERCTVLAEDVIPVDKLNPEELEETIVKIRAEVDNADQADADRLNKLIVQKEAVLQAMRSVKL